MLRSLALADLLTLGNAACETLAIFMCLKALDHGEPAIIWTAFGLLPVALVLDFMGAGRGAGEHHSSGRG